MEAKVGHLKTCPTQIRSGEDAVLLSSRSKAPKPIHEEGEGEEVFRKDMESPSVSIILLL